MWNCWWILIICLHVTSVSSEGMRWPHPLSPRAFQGHRSSELLVDLQRSGTRGQNWRLRHGSRHLQVPSRPGSLTNHRWQEKDNVESAHSIFISLQVTIHHRVVAKLKLLKTTFISKLMYCNVLIISRGGRLDYVNLKVFLFFSEFINRPSVTHPGVQNVLLLMEHCLSPLVNL